MKLGNLVMSRNVQRGLTVSILGSLLACSAGAPGSEPTAPGASPSPPATNPSRGGGTGAEGRRIAHPPTLPTTSVWSIRPCDVCGTPVACEPNYPPVAVACWPCIQAGA